ncbi:MAG: CarD family transcriptional regulator, partial [Peptostreptococcus anaerobius]
MLYSMEDVYYWMQDRKLIVNTHLAKAISDMNMVHNISIECRDIPSYNGKIDLLVEDIKRLRHSGYKIIIAAATKDRAKKINTMLNDNGVESFYSDSRNTEIKTSQVMVMGVNISHGFLYPSIKYQLITDREMLGNSKAGNKKTKKKKIKANSTKIDSFMELKLGDYVVHENSGVGKYTGIEQVSVNGIK